MLIIGYLVIIFAISEYNQSDSELLINEDVLRFEYINQGMTILKVTMVFYIVFLWIYSTRWNQYDIYLMWRKNKLSIVYSRFIMLTLLSLFLGLSYILILNTVMLLYPYSIKFDMVITSILSMVLFILFYNSLCLLLERLIDHVIGLFLPLILYLVSMLIGNGQYPETIDIDGNQVIQFIAPDMLLKQNVFTFLYGELTIVILIILLLQTTYWTVSKQDAIS